MPAGLQRLYGQGHLHFTTFSCYRRLPLLKSARARDVFVGELARVRERLGFRPIGYVVMPEHVHLLLSEPQRGTPSTVLHDLKLRVARRLRKRQRHAPAGQRTLPFGGAASAAARILAGTVLRFQCVHGAKEEGKAGVHAWQSRDAQTGIIPKGLGVEQLVELREGGARTDSG
jgi:REP element-mobilizing transposase RayT